MNLKYLESLELKDLRNSNEQKINAKSWRIRPDSEQIATNCNLADFLKEPFDQKIYIFSPPTRNLKTK